MTVAMGATAGTGNYVPCPYCGMGHQGVCPRVKAIEYHPDGTTKRVEFHVPTVSEQLATMTPYVRPQTT